MVEPYGGSPGCEGAVGGEQERDAPPVPMATALAEAACVEHCRESAGGLTTSLQWQDAARLRSPSMSTRDSPFGHRHPRTCGFETRRSALLGQTRVLDRTDREKRCMELRQAEHFIAVAEEGTFTGAARRVNTVLCSPLHSVHFE